MPLFFRIYITLQDLLADCALSAAKAKVRIGNVDCLEVAFVTFSGVQRIVMNSLAVG
jgi:hypothetical protein